MNRQQGRANELLTSLVQQLAELEKSGGLRILSNIRELLPLLGTTNAVVPRHELTTFRPQEVENLLGEVADTLAEVGCQLAGCIHSSRDGLVYVGTEAVAKVASREPALAAGQE